MKNIKEFLISTAMSMLVVASALFAMAGCSDDEEEFGVGTPTITDFSPKFATAEQETVITITGTNLRNPNCVKIGTEIILTDGAIFSWNSKEIRVRLTPEHATSGVITVVTAGGSASTTTEFVVKPSNAQLGKPVVENGDELTGGESYTNIELVGKNLNAVLQVMFGDAEAKIVSQEAGKLVVQIPYIGESKAVKLALKYTGVAGDEEFEEGTDAEAVVRTDFNVTEPAELPSFKECEESVINGYPFVITGTNLCQVEAVYLNEVDKNREINFTLENDSENDLLVCTINPEIITKLENNSIIVRFRGEQTQTLTEVFEIRLTEPIVNPLETTTVEMLTQLKLTGESLNIIAAVAIGGEMATIVTPEGGRINTELIVRVPYFEKETTADVVLKYRDITSADGILLEKKLDQQVTMTTPPAPVVTDVPEKALYNATFELGGTDLDKVEAVYLNEKKDENKLKFELSSDGKLVCSLKMEDLSEDIQIIEGANILLIEYWDGHKVLPLVQKLNISAVAPAITSLSATSVMFLDELTLNGTDLDMVSKVTVGDLEITNFKSKTATALTVQIPYFAEVGTKTLSVTYANAMAGGALTTVAYEDGVTVTRPVAPAMTLVEYDGVATTFDITGTGLDKVEEVLLGTTKVTISAATATKLTCVLPDDTAEGDYDVTISFWGGNETAQSKLTISYIPPIVTGMINDEGQAITEIEQGSSAVGNQTVFIFAGDYLRRITSVVLDATTISRNDITVSADNKTLRFTLANANVEPGNDKTFTFNYGAGKSVTVSGITIKKFMPNYVWKNVKIYGSGTSNPSFMSGSTGLLYTPCEFAANKDKIHFYLTSNSTRLRFETLYDAKGGTFGGNYKCDGESIARDGNKMRCWNLSYDGTSDVGKKYRDMVLNGTLETEALSTAVATQDGLFKSCSQAFLAYEVSGGAPKPQANNIMHVGDVGLMFVQTDSDAKAAIEFGLIQLKEVDLAEGSMTLDIYWEKKAE